MNRRPEAFLDTETTGLDPAIHEAISVAIVFDRSSQWLIPPDAICDLILKDDYFYYHSLIRPENLDVAEEQALQISGYRANPDRWRLAPTRAEVAPVIERLLRKAILVGHNIAFDHAFLQTLLSRSGLPTRLGRHRVDTVTLAWEHLNGMPGLKSFRLSAVCDFLGIPLTDEHDAMADTLRCRAVYQKLYRATILDRLRWRTRDFGRRLYHPPKD